MCPGCPTGSLARGRPSRPRSVRSCARATAAANGQRTGLAAFGHLTDSHVLDAANPGRLSFLWQYFDFTDGFPPSGLFRPQDLLTVHVLDATVRKLNAVGRGPISQRPLDCLVITGDLTNAFALSELSAAVGVFKGVPVTSHPAGTLRGCPGSRTGPARTLPEHLASGTGTLAGTPDDWKAVHGYPTVPGLLEAAIRPLGAEGSDFPWYVGVGNHDEAGRSGGDPVSAKTDFVDTLRVGDRLPMRLPPGIDELDFWETVKEFQRKRTPGPHGVHAVHERCRLRNSAASSARRTSWIPLGATGRRVDGASGSGRTSRAASRTTPLTYRRRLSASC